jgi:urea transporter
MDGIWMTCGSRYLARSAWTRGFSPVLTAVALGTVLTVEAQAAFNVALTPLAIPALTGRACW